MPGRQLIKQGWIKTYCRETGWGFIVCKEVERDIFVHWRGFLDPPRHNINGLTDLERIEVEFNLDESDPKKPKATEVAVMEGRRKMRRVPEDHVVDDRKTLRLVEAAVSSCSEREASRTWGRREGADLPPLRRGQRPKPPVAPLQDLGSPTRSAPSRPRKAHKERRGHLLAPPPRSMREPSPEDRPPLQRKVGIGLPRPPPPSRDADFFRVGGNGASRSRSRSLRRPVARRMVSRGDPRARPESDTFDMNPRDPRPPRWRSHSYEERPRRERYEERYAEERQTEEVCEKWPNAGGEMKVLLPNAMAEILDRDGVLNEIASKTKATVDLHDAVGGLHEICEGHRLLTLRGRGSELQAVIQSLLAKAEKMSRRSSGSEAQLKVLLPRFLASVVIGKRGANVKELQRETGTRVQVESGTMGQDRVTTLSGSSTCICNALGRIHHFGTEEGDEDAVPETDARDENGRTPHPTPRNPHDGGGLPAPWELKEHPEAPGEYYYLNTDTGETTWERPQDRPREKREKRYKSPPAPWSLQEHPEAPGEFYYLNEETGDTCWELPDNAV